MHTYTHIHTCADTHKHPYIHEYIYIYVYIIAFSCTCAGVCAYVCVEYQGQGYKFTDFPSTSILCIFPKLFSQCAKSLTKSSLILLSIIPEIRQFQSAITDLTNFNTLVHSAFVLLAFKRLETTLAQ